MDVNVCAFDYMSILLSENKSLVKNAMEYRQMDIYHSSYGNRSSHDAFIYIWIWLKFKNEASSKTYTQF